MNARRFVLFLAAALLALPGRGTAQQIRTAVVPETVTVGDVFRAAVRVDLPAGYQVEAPDSLPVAGDLENAGPRREAVDTLPDGGQRLTVSYPLTAWRPGPASLPAVPIRIIGPEENRVVEATLPVLTVRSVLPPDTSRIQPRPLKDVLGGIGTVWPLIIAALAMLSAGEALGFWLIRRHRRPTAAPVRPSAPPKERALAALDRAANAGLIEAGDFKAFYSLVTEAVRHYLAELDPGWGADLTTSELIARFRRDVDEPTASALRRVLDAADLVKFARRVPTATEAIAEWRAARDWVAAFDWPPRPAADLPATAEVA